MGRGDGVVGTVQSVDGSTLTVAGLDGTTYTVQTSSDTTVKLNANGTMTEGSLSDVAAGDTVRVEGTVDGTTVTADEIHDGDMPFGGPGGAPGAGQVPGSVSGQAPGAGTGTGTSGTSDSGTT
jgi:hypothetical protein